jgi:hypothetical protein
VPPQHAALVGDCDRVVAQFVHVPRFKEAIQRKDELKREFDALNAVRTNFLAIARVGAEHKAAIAAVAQIPLSEEDYQTLSERHEAVVSRVTTTCAQLTDMGEFGALEALASKLEELMALDTTGLPQSWDNDPVYVPPTTATANGASAADEDDGSNDPVYVPPRAENVR